MPHLVEDVLVEVGHVTLTGHGAIVVIPEVLLQGHGVMGDVQDRVQVVGQHLGQRDSLLSCTQSGLDQRTDSIGLSVHPHPALTKFSSGTIHSDTQEHTPYFPSFVPPPYSDAPCLQAPGEDIFRSYSSAELGFKPGKRHPLLLFNYDLEASFYKPGLRSSWSLSRGVNGNLGFQACVARFQSPGASHKC